MSGYRGITLAAAGAALLGTAPLGSVFRSVTWLFFAIAMVFIVLAAALTTRALRWPVWAQVSTMFGGLLLLLSWLFGAGTTVLGVIPTPSTLGRFVQLIAAAGADSRELAAPVPDTDGLLFVAAVSVGVVAVLIDLVAVVARQPALAGLPLLAIYSIPVAVLTEHVSWISFAVASAGFMWLLVADNIGRVRRWGRRFTGDGRDVDIWESSPLAAAGRRLGMLGIVAAVLVPLALPQMTASVLDRLIAQAGFNTGPGSGNGRMIDPVASLQGNLTQPELRTLLRVYTDDPRPGYLRLAVSGEITEGGARPRRPDQSRVVSDGTFPPAPVQDRRTFDRKTYTAQVEIVDLWQGLLPTYLNTREVGLGRDAGRWFYDDNTAVVWSSRSTTRKGMRYDLSYVRYEYTSEQLRSAGWVDGARAGENVTRFTAVPPNQAVESLVDRLIDGKQTQYDQVRAIHDHFSKKNGFRYSEEVPEATTGTAIESFLENKIGFCQQYATAMTWMLRTAQIPARVAIGFTQGTKEADGFTISNWDAHAWVEVYFSDIGWVPFDPTPASQVRNEIDDLEYAPNPYEPAPEVTPSTSAGSGDDGSAAPTTRGGQRDPGQEAGAAGDGSSGPPNRSPYLVVGALLLLGLLAAPGVRRRMIRRRRSTTAAAAASKAEGSRDAAYAAWDELLDTLVDLDIGYRTSETPRGVMTRLLTTRPPLVSTSRNELELLAHAAERANYSPDPLRSDRLEPALRAVCAELHTTVPRGRQIIALLFPASVLRRWRQRSEAIRERLLVSVDRFRNQISRRLPKRRRERTAR